MNLVEDRRSLFPSDEDVSLGTLVLVFAST
jgi:hypothetical protein